LLSLNPSPLPPAPPYRLLFVGIVRPYKGLDVGLDALRDLRARGIDATLTVAGEFWEPVSRWREEIVRLGLTEAVDIRPGYVPDALMQELFDTHHLAIAPYRSATQSAIVPVAYAAGRPVVATRVGGLAECVVDGETGVLAPPADPHGFASAIERALRSLEALAAGARASRSTWRDVVDALIEVSGPSHS
jgi:glycosyltransferase involved in cell wall biosynthesis